MSGLFSFSEGTRFLLGEGAVHVLIVDNYDSFTYNLVQVMSGLDVTLEVVRNDALTVDEVLAAGADALVLSPGPGRPEDAGICVELLARRPAVPILGVCLGHQALGHAFGARVERAPVPMHGKTSWIQAAEHPLFEGLPRPFEATRYHSLCVAEETLPAELEPLAWSEDGVLQAMAHRGLPYLGVQFHPESVLTAAGPRLLANFVESAARAAVR
ncbi:MAG TPA: aminodeoxychorismate/anthranilate synthase component II [Thermoanaerobaculia bacterium]|nr:aminodeoxychorismate/anthranilate synthase component II [Thermoanaerobaculia bacterium]